MKATPNLKGASVNSIPQLREIINIYFLVIRVDSLQWDRSLHSKVPNLYVEVGVGRIFRKTRTIKDKPHIWNETLSLYVHHPLRFSIWNSCQQYSPAAAPSNIPSIKVLHKSAIPFREDICIGSINIEPSELSRRCVNGPGMCLFSIFVCKSFTIG